MDAKGIVLTPSQVHQLRMRYPPLRRDRDPVPITGSIGAYEGLPIVELPIGGAPAPDGFVDLRELD